MDIFNDSLEAEMDEELNVIIRRLIFIIFRWFYRNVVSTQLRPSRLWKGKNQNIPESCIK